MPPIPNEHRLRELEDSLAERENVIQLLTQQLEQAADQLDRVHRSGNDRRGSAQPGIPAELIESQRTVLDQMTHMLSQWEELQATQMLNRIESQISEIHDLVSSGASVFTGPDIESGRDPVTSSTPSIFVNEPTGESPKSAWEAMKAALMAGESSVTSDALLADSTASASATPTVSEPQQALPDPPPFVNIDEANEDELRQAVQVRDEFISTLIRRFSSQTHSTRLPNWELLNHVPAALRSELEHLQLELKQTLRVAEVDLALQRARLAREESRLQSKADQVDKKARDLGLSTIGFVLPPNPAAKNNTEEQQAQQGRRWLQFLQRSTVNTHPGDKRQSES